VARSRVDNRSIRRKCRGKWTEPGDEMVPILGRRVRSALRQRRMTAGGLARKTGELPQTIHQIVAGKTRHCRRRRRDALAGALGVPPDWLSHQEVGLTYSYSFGGIEAACDDPTLAQLAESEFLGRCVKALGRDLEKTSPDPELKRLWWVLATLDAPMRFAELIRPTFWRELLLAPVARNDAPRSCLTEAQIEEATDAFARAFTIVLGDWFEGRRMIDFKAIGGVRSLLLRGAHGEKDDFVHTSIGTNCAPFSPKE
jgi:transcriptional regulator with XRE-family HTH domain